MQQSPAPSVSERALKNAGFNLLVAFGISPFGQRNEMKAS